VRRPSFPSAALGSAAVFVSRSYSGLCLIGALCESGSPRRKEAQIERACAIAIAHALNRGKMVLVEPPQR
jgi:hypothetical protein